MNEKAFFNRLSKLKLVQRRCKIFGKPFREKRTGRCPLCAVAAAEGHDVGDLNYMRAGRAIKMSDKLTFLIACAADGDNDVTNKYNDKKEQRTILRIRKKLEALIQ